MDKRKLSIKKSGNQTITSNKFGTNYEKTSSIKTIRANMDILSGDEFSLHIDQINQSNDPDQLLRQIEENILSWLNNNGLPVDDLDEKNSDGRRTRMLLSERLKQRHIDKKGVTQAAKCLFEIVCIKASIKANDYKSALATTLGLVFSYRNWGIALMEGQLELGHFKNEMKKENRTLNDADIEKVNATYNDYLTKFKEYKVREMNQRAKNATIDYIKEFLGKDVSRRTLNRYLGGK